MFINFLCCSGQRLFDYIKQKSTNDINEDNTVQYSNVTFEREIDQDSGNFDENNSDSSEGSYTDLIFNYATQKVNETTDVSKSNENIIKKSLTDFSSLSDHFQKSTISEATDTENSISDEVFLRPCSSTGDLINKSKILKNSASDSSLQGKLLKESGIKFTRSQGAIQSKIVKRQSSEKSFTEEFSIVTYISPLRDVVKWASQILLALEKLHRCGVTVT